MIGTVKTLDFAGVLCTDPQCCWSWPQGKSLPKTVFRITNTSNGTVLHKSANKICGPVLFDPSSFSEDSICQAPRSGKTKLKYASSTDSFEDAKLQFRNEAIMSIKVLIQKSGYILYRVKARKVHSNHKANNEAVDELVGGLIEIGLGGFLDTLSLPREVGETACVVNVSL